MVHYQDIRPDEILQAGDEYWSGPSAGWLPLAADQIGVRRCDTTLCCRRPVECVSLEEYTRLEKCNLELQQEYTRTGLKLAAMRMLERDATRPRYLLFATNDKTLGGAWDLRWQCDSLAEIREMIAAYAAPKGLWKWWHVFDTVMRTIVDKSQT